MANSDTSNTSKTSTYGAGIYSKNSESFSLSDSTFSLMNFAEYGGAIYLESDTKTSIPTTASHSISNTTFSGNIAYQGGAIYVKEIDYLSISNTTITQNSVTTSTAGVQGKGGAIYYSSSSNFNYSYFSFILPSFIHLKLNTIK